MKTLILHRHSSKTPDGKRISAEGANLANLVAGDMYVDADVDIVFHGPLLRTLQTLSFMMLGNQAFNKAVQCPEPIMGLGNNAMFAEMFPAELKAQMPNKHWSNFDAVINYHPAKVSNEFGLACIHAIEQMFALMTDGQLGVGVFHDPTISLAAWFLGYTKARSLSDMESITFIENDDGYITVSGINTVD